MAKLTLKGNPIETNGELPKVGAQAPNFNLVATDLSEKSLQDFSGSRVVLNIFPSVDTPTCAASVRAFNKKASELENTKVLCISRDLPFAMGRFCGGEGLEDVVSLSDFRDAKFGEDYGLLFDDGPLKGLHSRAVVVVDEKGSIVYNEQVTEVADEPNYEAALAVL